MAQPTSVEISYEAFVKALPMKDKVELLKLLLKDVQPSPEQLSGVLKRLLPGEWSMLPLMGASTLGMQTAWRSGQVTMICWFEEIARCLKTRIVE